MNPIKAKKKFVILVDGECEYWYLQMLKRNHKSLPIDLKPEIPQKKTLAEQYKKVNSYAKDYDKVIWIVDLDVVNRETRNAKKGAKTPLNQLQEYASQIAKRKDGKVLLIVNSPCLEYGLLLHFEKISKYFDTCEGAHKQLLKHFPKYEKNQKFYTSICNDIFQQLKKNLTNAVENAKKMPFFSIENAQKGFSEMHLLFELNEFKGIFDESKEKNVEQKK